MERFSHGEGPDEEVKCRFCGGQDGVGHFLGTVRFPPSFTLENSLNSCPSWLVIVAIGPDACNGTDGCLVSVLLSSVTPGLLLWVSWLTGRWSEFWVFIRLMILASCFWTPSDFWDAEDLANEIGERPCVWTDGSREDYPAGGFEVAGAGFICLHLSWPWRVLFGEEEYGDAWLDRCRSFMPVLGRLQTVQRAEYWGANLALHAFWPLHSGIDNLNVVRSIGRLLVWGSPSNLSLYHCSRMVTLLPLSDV